MKGTKRLILASASPRRRVLLAEAGYEFEIAPADVDESFPEGAAPEDAAVAVAERKARAAGKIDNAVVLAADTVVVSADGKTLGKPSDEEDARAMLGDLSDSTHRVITGVFVMDTESGATLARAVSTQIVFGEMSDEKIDAYVASGEAMGKAGAYAIQETGDRFVREVRGSFSNVVGLPMRAVREMLDEMGIADAAGAPYM